MKSYKLYLPLHPEDEMFCTRFEHLFKMIDREYQEVRVYKIGIDLQKDEVPPLPATPPFATVDGELITFGDLFHEVMVKSGRAEDKSYMDYDKDLGND
tara:strand:- start:935 stop:1228 length:294 start_codon:yes stop_codon:yes gene_type:complete